MYLESPPPRLQVCASTRALPTHGSWGWQPLIFGDRGTGPRVEAHPPAYHHSGLQQCHCNSVSSTADAQGSTFVAIVASMTCWALGNAGA